MTNQRAPLTAYLSYPGSELLMKMKISLSEALTGFSRKVKTLDNRDIAITLTPGGFVQHEGKSTFYFDLQWGIQITRPEIRSFLKKPR